jgi:putative membrane protein
MIKNRLTTTVVATSFALFSMAAFAQADTSTGTSTPTQPPAKQQPGMGPATNPAVQGDPNAQRGQGQELAKEDRDFLENAAQSGHAEIEGSRMAQESDAGPAVRQFAQKMIEDHTQANKELIDLANRKGFTVPDEPSLAQRTELLALKALSGGAFDTMYSARIAVAAHENAVELFEKATQEVKDADIRAYAEKTLPKLREHLEMARALREQVKNN